MESDSGLYGATASGYGFGQGLSESPAAASPASERWSPGMARARRRAARGDSFIEVTARAIDSPSDGGFSKGSRVFHQKFGYGRVMRVEGNRLDIEFDQAGRKKVIASFVRAAERAG